MEWLLAHEGEPIPAQPAVQQSTPESSNAPETPVADPNDAPATDEATSSSDAASAKSLKCDECNRLFKTQLEVEFHAAKSGHSSFSESTEEKKPLTEGEKVAQLQLLEEKLKAKRVAREAEDKKEELEREKVRIKMGKEMTETKRKMEEDEMAKLVQLRKREKEEEKAARDRVKAQIEADKAARRAKMDATSPTSPPVNSPPPPPTQSSGPKKDYTTTKIQIRLPDGQAVTEEFDAKENLAAVKVFIEINHYDSPFRLMTAYPRKVFDDADLEKPLAALGESQILFLLNQQTLLSKPLKADCDCPSLDP